MAQRVHAVVQRQLVANNYIAVFSHFIPPGVWEAVYVIEGLMKGSQLSISPDTVHSDTQGQSVTVFAFTHLLGINLMPRIRNWKDLQLRLPGHPTTPGLDRWLPVSIRAPGGTTLCGGCDSACIAAVDSCPAPTL